MCVLTYVHEWVRIQEKEEVRKLKIHGIFKFFYLSCGRSRVIFLVFICDRCIVRIKLVVYCPSTAHQSGCETPLWSCPLRVLGLRSWHVCKSVAGTCAWAGQLQWWISLWCSTRIRRRSHASSYFSFRCLCVNWS